MYGRGQGAPGVRKERRAKRRLVMVGWEENQDPAMP